MAKHIVKGKNITLTSDFDTMKYSVEFAGKTWIMTEMPYIVFSSGEKIEFPKPEESCCRVLGVANGVEAVYKGFGNHNISVRTRTTVDPNIDEIAFMLQVEGDDKCEIKYISYPAPFDFGKAFGDKADKTDKNLPSSYTILPRMQGILIPAGDEIKLHDGQIFDRDGYMPLFGQVRGNTGYLAIYETPYDARYELRYADDGEKVAALWDTSLGFVAYPRVMKYRFMKDCDYNDFAHEYRSYVQQRGKLVTLKEKFVRNPKAEKLLGCPVIHDGIAKKVSPVSVFYNAEQPEMNESHVPFSVRAEQLKELHKKGLQKAYTHFDGWGKHGYDNLHPDPFPPHEAAGGAEGMRYLAETTKNLGYIFGIHDQYRDFYYDAPSFTLENAVMNADGSHPFCSIWHGGEQTVMCPSVSREYVKRNYAMFEELGIDIQASYLDVFSVFKLDECFNPAHPVTREQCAQMRRECLDYLTSRGIIPSSEEAIDCISPSLVLCHHAPYYTVDLGGAPSDCAGIPIPLFNLVYHDCIVIPWTGRKNKKGGWGIPQNDSGYAFAALNANPMYLSIEADEEYIAEIMEICEYAEKMAFEQMVKHEFLSDDLRIQRTTFSDGSIVEVNFDTNEIVRKQQKN